MSLTLLRNGGNRGETVVFSESGAWIYLQTFWWQTPRRSCLPLCGNQVRPRQTKWSEQLLNCFPYPILKRMSQGLERNMGSWMWRRRKQDVRPVSSLCGGEGVERGPIQCRVRGMFGSWRSDQIRTHLVVSENSTCRWTCCRSVVSFPGAACRRLGLKLLLCCCRMPLSAVLLENNLFNQRVTVENYGLIKHNLCLIA